MKGYFNISDLLQQVISDQMSARNYINNTNSNELANQSKGGVEHVIPGDTSSTGPSTSGTPGIEHAQVDQAPRLDGIREATDAKQVLDSDQVQRPWGGLFNRETTSAR